MTESERGERERERVPGMQLLALEGALVFGRGRSLIESKKRGFSLGFDPIPASFPDPKRYPLRFPFFRRKIPKLSPFFI